MATSVWGVDSVTPANQVPPGCSSTAAQIVHSMGGGNVVFWGRYFGYQQSGFKLMNSESASQIQAEASAMRGAGLRRIVPLNSPRSITSSTNKSDGTFHGNKTCDGIKSVIANSAGKIIMPSSLQVNVYLGVQCY